MYSIWSSVYLEQEVDSYNCYVSEKLWKRITNEHNSSRVFARIIKDDKSWICSLGQPIRTDFIEEIYQNVFIPSWMLEQINCNGDGDLLKIDWFPTEAFDHSTKIVLKPYDKAFEVGDIQEQLSYELTKLGILQKNTNIHIKMPELDGFEVVFNVVSVEPASVVLCEGDEVELEFDYSLIEEPIAAAARPPSPYPYDALPEVLYPEPSTPIMEPSASAPILGGIKREERYNPWRNKDFKPNTT
jgi:hypothetical protein